MGEGLVNIEVYFIFKERVTIDWYLALIYAAILSVFSSEFCEMLWYRKKTNNTNSFAPKVGQIDPYS